MYYISQKSANEQIKAELFYLFFTNFSHSKKRIMTTILLSLQERRSVAVTMVLQNATVHFP